MTISMPSILDINVTDSFSDRVIKCIETRDIHT